MAKYYIYQSENNNSFMADWPGKESLVSSGQLTNPKKYFPARRRVLGCIQTGSSANRVHQKCSSSSMLCESKKSTGEKEIRALTIVLKYFVSMEFRRGADDMSKTQPHLSLKLSEIHLS